MISVHSHEKDGIEFVRDRDGSTLGCNALAYADALYNLAYYLARNEADAEDLPTACLHASCGSPCGRFGSERHPTTLVAETGAESGSEPSRRPERDLRSPDYRTLAMTPAERAMGETAYAPRWAATLWSAGSEAL